MNAPYSRYQKGDYNEIAITRSKVRIYNPGSILDNVNPVEFANGRIGSKIRNPLIATVLFKNGLIDAFGTGFDRTFKVCAENSVDYEYYNDDFGFIFIFERKKLSNNDKINNLDKEIIRLLKENAYITIPELAQIVSKSEPTVYRHINTLMNKNVVVRVGSRKSGYWKVN